jgi:hypothetical protein
MAKVTYQDRESTFKPPVKPGDYVLGVEKAEIVISKSSGDEQVKLELRVLTQENGQTVQGPLVFDYLQFSDKAVWKVDVFLKSIKRQPTKGTEIDITDEWLKMNVVGALGWATLGMKEFNGKPSNELVRWISSGKPDQYQQFKIENKVEVAPF